MEAPSCRLKKLNVSIRSRKSCLSSDSMEVLIRCKLPRAHHSHSLFPNSIPPAIQFHQRLTRPAENTWKIHDKPLCDEQYVFVQTRGSIYLSGLYTSRFSCCSVSTFQDQNPEGLEDAKAVLAGGGAVGREKGECAKRENR